MVLLSAVPQDSACSHGFLNDSKTETFDSVRTSNGVTVYGGCLFGVAKGPTETMNLVPTPANADDPNPPSQEMSMIVSSPEST